MNTPSRRQFVTTLFPVAAGLSLCGSKSSLLAVEAFQRPAPPRLQLSLAAYSFRDFFKDASHPRSVSAQPNRQMDMFQFIDYCATHGCAGAELTSYYFPAEISSDYLLRVRRHAFLRGVAVSGTAVGNDFTIRKGSKRDAEIASVKTWIDRAVVLGAPHIRVFAGAGKGLEPSEARSLCIAGLEECCDYAGRKGIFLGIENHGGIVAEPEGLLGIVRAVKSPWLGINLDTGNFHTSPYEDLVRCAPFAINVQYKTEVKFKDRKENEPADLKRVVRILRDVNYQGYVALEYEAAEDPWSSVPRHLEELKRALASESRL